MSIFTILFTAALVNNFVLSQFLGICPFLGVSKKVETAAGRCSCIRNYDCLLYYQFIV